MLSLQQGQQAGQIVGGKAGGLVYLDGRNRGLWIAPPVWEGGL